MGKYCIVVTGVPGSGKTTIGREISLIPDAPILDRDDLLEHLFEQMGTGDASRRLSLGLESDDLFRNQAILLERVVLVSHWRPIGSKGPSGTPTDWVLGAFERVVELYCACPSEEAARRFKQRTRHPGHLDSEKSMEKTLKWIDGLQNDYPLWSAGAISVHTSDTLRLEVAGDRIRERLQG